MSRLRGPCLISGVMILMLTSCGQREPATSDAYTPQAVFCPDGGDTLCGTMPAFIGPNPAISVSVGYSGLTHDVTSAKNDSQTPFDNMSWQMFYSLNQMKDGLYAWQNYKLVEDVFGGDPSPCDNPGNLPVLSITTKAGGGTLSSLDDEILGDNFLEAAVNLPLVDRNGNFTVYERRLNDVELAYLKNDKWDLTTLEGQKKFVESGNTVNFTESAKEADGSLGAIELKMAWRVLDTDKGDDPSRYITMNALLAVDAALVRDSDQPICDPVLVGLVGFHIIQKNPTDSALLPEWIWSTFEHMDNAPLSPNACDPVDGGCFLVSDPPVCDAPADAQGAYSYFNSACTDGGNACPPNEAPDKLSGESTYLWSAQQPYAGAYLYDNQFGTQVARCWQIYDLTQQINKQWIEKLGEANSTLANYMLVGTQWGGTIEPKPPPFFDNGDVPSFLSNTTLETYVQTKEFGTCIGCHQGANLAYTTEVDGKKKTYSANFSYLLQLAK